MGAISPVPFADQTFLNKVEELVVKPTILGLQKDGIDYRGFIFIGLMNDNGKPSVVEYNVRMGDPECQTLLPKLKTDFSIIINKCIEQELHDLNIEWYDDKSICIVLCSKGYPDTYQNNITLDLEKLKLKKNQFIFHAGTKIINNTIVSNGGRVLNIVTRSDDFKSARDSSLELLKEVNWDNGFYRKDIGYKVIKE